MSWEDLEDPFFAFGTFWIIKKDGKPNTMTIEQIVNSLVWTPDFDDVVMTEPPKRTVQITVKADEYGGKTRYKVTWLNPEDYVPGSGGITESDLDQLKGRFGSLLRAAGAAAMEKRGGANTKEEPATQPAGGPPSGAPRR